MELLATALCLTFLIAACVGLLIDAVASRFNNNKRGNK